MTTPVRRLTDDEKADALGEIIAGALLRKQREQAEREREEQQKGA